MEQKHPGGRPICYTKEKGDLICEGISEGKSLTKVISAEGMPSVATVFKWMREYPEFLKNYETAREERTELQNEMLLDMGDEAVVMAENSEAPSAVVSAVKLKADNFKWVMSKMKPKRYGDKMDVTSDGEKIQGNTIIFTDFNNEAES